MPRIYVAGALVYDMVFAVPDWIAPNRAVHATQLTMSPGGKALNQAAAACLLGGKVSLIGCVGDDLFGAEMLSALRDIGVDVKHVFVRENARTSVAAIVVKDRLPAFIGAPDASRKLNASDIDEALSQLSAEDLLLIDFELPQPMVRHALQLASKAGATAILNPAPFFTRDAFVCEYLPLVDVIIPNMLEAQLILGDESDDADALGRELLRRGVGSVVMTLGEEGCVLYDGDDRIAQAAFALDAVDTTGASDAFVGAYALCLAEGWPAKRGLRFATAAAGLACSKHGTMSALPRLEEVQSLLRGYGI